MQIEFTKGAITLFGRVEKGDILNISEQSAMAFIQAGFAKIPAKKSTSKAKKATAEVKKTETEDADA